MSDLDALRRQAQNEHSQNLGWQNTTTWDAEARKAYEAERERQRQADADRQRREQEEAARKAHGGW